MAVGERPRDAMPGFCRDCLADVAAAVARCPACGSPRLARHRTLATLALAHIDCDAFYATVEKRDREGLADKPVIVGGGKRGVVAAACYIARTFGVRSAMPMFKARALCPDAVVIAPDMAKYVRVGREVRQAMLALTPLVEPLSIDEAFLDLSGTGDRGATRDAAIAMAREIQKRIADEHGLGASIGIGPNKLIAKMASGVNKPRGLTPMSEEEFRGVFWPQDVQALWGVGPKLSEHLKRLGLATVGDLARASEPMLEQAFGVVGVHLKHAAWGRDQTPVVPYHEGVDPKSMGHEVTLSDDSRDEAFLEGQLLRLCDQVARRLRGEGFVARTVTLKLRDFRFRTITRQKALGQGVDDHIALYEVVRALWRANWKGEPLRLVGVSASALEHKGDGEQGELFASDDRRRSLQEALDKVRDKLGELVRTVTEAMNVKRRVVENLRPALLDHFGLPTALEAYFDETCKRAGIECRTTIPDETGPIPQSLAIALFRVGQESLTNIIRHARARHVEMTFEVGAAGYHLSVSDDGIGMDAEKVRSSHGLAGMRHRVVSLNGTFEIQSAPGTGTRLDVLVPFADGAAA